MTRFHVQTLRLLGVLVRGRNVTVRRKDSLDSSVFTGVYW